MSITKNIKSSLIYVWGRCPGCASQKNIMAVYTHRKSCTHSRGTPSTCLYIASGGSSTATTGNWRFFWALNMPIFPSYKTIIHNISFDTFTLISHHNSITCRQFMTHALWLIIFIFLIFCMIRDDLVIF